MLPLKQYLRRRVGPKEAAVVIVVLAALAALGYAGYEFVAAKVLEARVRAALPRVCAALRQQRQTLVSAIEAYKAHFGVYPADHVLSRQPLVVDAVTNSLVYELAGVTYDPNRQTFSVARLEAAEAKFVKEFFHCDGFRNCAQDPDQVQHFLSENRLPLGQFHDDPDVFVLRAAAPNESLDPEALAAINTSTWRYVSSMPTNNPGRFDLWLEVQANGKQTIIGNWNAAN